MKVEWSWYAFEFVEFIFKQTNTQLVVLGPNAEEHDFRFIWSQNTRQSLWCQVILCDANEYSASKTCGNCGVLLLKLGSSHTFHCPNTSYRVETRRDEMKMVKEASCDVTLQPQLIYEPAITRCLVLAPCVNTRAEMDRFIYWLLDLGKLRVHTLDLWLFTGDKEFMRSK